jgi:hypothetical protein
MQSSETNQAQMILIQQQLQQVLPSASTFDFIPSIHSLISRLLLDPADKDAIQPKDLTNEIAAIRQKIHRARVTIENLPDIQRTIENQELEIKDLETKIARQRGQLASIRRETRQI